MDSGVGKGLYWASEEAAAPGTVLLVEAPLVWQQLQSSAAEVAVCDACMRLVGGVVFGVFFSLVCLFVCFWFVWFGFFFFLGKETWRNGWSTRDGGGVID